MSSIYYPNHKVAAKTIAGLMLLQMALGLLLNFYFLTPILTFDDSASIEEITVILGCATLVALLISAMNLVFGLLLPKSRIKEYEGTFISLIVLAAVGIALCAYEYAKLAEYVSFLSSFSVHESNTSFMKKMLAVGRNEAHFFSIFMSSCSLAAFYILLIRAELIAKWIAYLALASCVLQLIAVGHTFFQAPIPSLAQLPLALSQLLVPIYLLAAGFLTSLGARTDNLQSNS
ncbi:DUF4386 family protein [Pseudoalteromonas sp. MMG013]|uniref:DUF4386 family protein n=1 Tax=Pseudoalteromonas sp. MMG013 TaxID=2822687 RepID=UPI001B37413E|nr:DUF4386 family protein [Pseudoalteromonas sp. MMG013]MBQ4863238.1 DUF4386 family protein [Pseudoalteromonas sp. MMG013]